MKTQIEKSEQARQLFKSVVKGANFMTPHILGFYPIINGAAELSEGDFMGEEMFGVTIAKDGEHNFDLSKVFDNKQEALNYITSLA